MMTTASCATNLFTWPQKYRRKYAANFLPNKKGGFPDANEHHDAKSAGSWVKAMNKRHCSNLTCLKPVGAIRPRIRKQLYQVPGQRV